MKSRNAASPPPRAMPSTRSQGAWPVAAMLRKLGRRAVTAVCGLILFVGGCSSPPQLKRVVPFEPSPASIEAAERIALVSKRPVFDESEGVSCVRNAIPAFWPEKLIIQTSEYRRIPGADGSLFERYPDDPLTSLQDESEIRLALLRKDVRFVIEIDSYIMPFYVFRIDFWQVRAWIVDIKNVAITGPTIVRIDKGHNWAGAMTGMSDACHHMAAMIVSAITGRPLEELDPELAKAVAEGAAQ